MLGFFFFYDKWLLSNVTGAQPIRRVEWWAKTVDTCHMVSIKWYTSWRVGGDTGSTLEKQKQYFAPSKKMRKAKRKNVLEGGHRDCRRPDGGSVETHEITGIFFLLFFFTSEKVKNLKFHKCCNGKASERLALTYSWVLTTWWHHNVTFAL